MASLRINVFALVIEMMPRASFNEKMGKLYLERGNADNEIVDRVEDEQIWQLFLRMRLRQICKRASQPVDFLH